MYVYVCMRESERERESKVKETKGKRTYRKKEKKSSIQLLYVIYLKFCVFFLSFL